MKFVNKKKALDLVAKGALFVDMRSPVAFRDNKVTDSVNLPLKNFLNKLTGLPRKQKIVIFGESKEDGDVKTANGYADQLGFTDLFVATYTDLIGD